MPRLAFFCVVSWAVIGLGCSSPEPAPDAAVSPIDSLLQAYVDSGRVPGVVAIAASTEGIFYQGVFGYKDEPKGERMSVDTIFRIASMTKPVTSVAVMQLVERGKVELDESAAMYVPELWSPEVLEGFDDEGAPRLRDASRPPTVRELLSHTSGYAYSLWNADIQRFEAESDLLGGRGKFAQLPLASDPGTRWEYSPSTDVLGILVEAVSGLSLEAYFRQHIFAPLGMHDTFFRIPAIEWARVSRQHSRLPDGGYEPNQPLGPAPPQVEFYSGGGGLSSTAPDYIRFVRALLNGGALGSARILEAETIDEMARNQIGDFEAGEMISVAPNLSNDVHLFPDSIDRFGLGFLINSEPVPGGRSAGSLMWAGLHNTYFWIDREKDIGGVLMTQMLPFADPGVLELLGEFEKAVYASRAAKSD